MPVTNYYTLNGEIRGESTNGVRTDYLRDALGSVTATVDSSAVVLNTYRYKPYGARLAKTGASGDPSFLFTGTSGSRPTAVAYAEQYNQARHYGSSQGNWTTVDDLWPEESAYGYVAGNPTTWIDPSGMRPPVGNPKPKPVQIPPFHPDWPGNPFEPSPYPGLPPRGAPGLPGGAGGAGAGVGAGAGLAAGPTIILCLGVIATADLINYSQTGRTGPITGIGDWIGHKLFPDPTEDDAMCPPPVDFATADNDRRRHIRDLGKCQLIKQGQTVDAYCDGGTHQTNTYKCGTKRYSSSITCCPCKDKTGEHIICSANTHPARF